MVFLFQNLKIAGIGIGYRQRPKRFHVNLVNSNARFDFGGGLW